MMDAYEIPLFPLNTVLFPGMSLPLHIFEERYKEMVNWCMMRKRPFGVVLIHSGVAEGGPMAEPHVIGCTAQITQMQPLSQGRMFIMAVGHERFRILSLNNDQPYLVGRVEQYPLLPEAGTHLEKPAQTLYPLVIDYLQVLADLGQVDLDLSQIPQDYKSLPYLAASLIQIPTEQKQRLLAARRASTLLHDLYTIYREQTAILRLMPRSDQEAFSLN
ncbi:MAG: LON peptidase substrate-binding domain-containing protein [Chloroflexota bacterium]